MAALNMPSPQPQPQPKPQRYHESHLFNACFDGHHEELNQILRRGGLDVDWAQPGTGMTAAYIAAQEGHDKCLSQLLSHGADMSKASKDGNAPIHIACQFGRYACIELLADSRAGLNLPVADGSGSTPTMLCCKNGHVKCLALLSEKGANLSLANNHGLTAAHLASQTGQLKCLQLLGKRGAALSKKDAYGSTPLDHARVYKHRECVDLLLASGSTGAEAEDLLPATEANKVCVSIVLQSVFILAFFP
jgi:ankyrin repeat protein